VTMDNRPPETVAAIANNPRKISIKMHLSHTREQDNKCVHGICVVWRCVATPVPALTSTPCLFCLPLSPLYLHLHLHLEGACCSASAAF
jgi:hypothetical protein